MKAILIIFCLLFCNKPFTAAPSLDEVRQMYISAATDESSCDKLIDLISEKDAGDNSLLLGYKGCATMMKAKYVFNPFSKLNYFSKGKTMLEKAIATDNKNPELIYLRFAVQINAPSFLGYHKEIKSDRIFLTNSVKDISDDYLKKLINDVLKNSAK